MTVDCASVVLDNKDDVARFEELYASDADMPTIGDYSTFGGPVWWEEIELATDLFTLRYEPLSCRWIFRRMFLGNKNGLWWFWLICGYF
jgi:hypothetical protein